jgi:hypothetical protein
MLWECLLILSFSQSSNAALRFSFAERALRFDDSDATKFPASRPEVTSTHLDENETPESLVAGYVRRDKFAPILRPIWILDRVFDNASYAKAVQQRLRIAFTQDKAVILLNKPRARPWIKLEPWLGDNRRQNSVDISDFGTWECTSLDFDGNHMKLLFQIAEKTTDGVDRLMYDAVISAVPRMPYAVTVSEGTIFKQRFITMRPSVLLPPFPRITARFQSLLQKVFNSKLKFLNTKRTDFDFEIPLSPRPIGKFVLKYLPYRPVVSPSFASNV